MMLNHYRTPPVVSLDTHNTVVATIQAIASGQAVKITELEEALIEVAAHRDEIRDERENANKKVDILTDQLSTLTAQLEGCRDARASLDAECRARRGEDTRADALRERVETMWQQKETYKRLAAVRLATVGLQKRAIDEYQSILRLFLSAPTIEAWKQRKDI